jgi:heat shock protein HspQ
MILFNSELYKKTEFHPGDLIRHRRYGYRGIIVAYDHECKANQSWYQSNQTQPERSQAWYHVLVHGSDSITYAAESSLQADPSKQVISHPLLDIFFDEFDGQTYARNNAPWPQQ